MDKFEIISEKAKEQDMSSEVGMKSSGEGLDDDRRLIWILTLFEG